MTDREQLVKDHAEAMAQVITLPKNSAKGHWGDLDIITLFTLLNRELEEFGGALWGHIHHGRPLENVISESADVSIFMAMITDNLKKRRGDYGM